MRAPRLILFVKAPRPGSVKTRLARSIGSEAAAAAYRMLVEQLLSSLRELKTVELRFAPDDSLAEIQPWLQPDWSAQPQGDGDLGHRMQFAFAEAFAFGIPKVVLIGSDCPCVTPADILMAWEHLSEADLVLGPAADGGYWLIGLRAPHPELFRNISWSSASVFEETLRRAAASKLRVHLLRQLRDIDTEDDWREFLKLS